VEGKNIYAIVEISGKQYRVTPGQTIDVDSLNAAEGQTIEFDKVLALGDDGKTTIGKPYVEGAKVTATSKGLERGRKVIVFRFKAKTRSRKKTGHIPLVSRITIDKIEAAGIPTQQEAASGT
jgi:large subunit ribosomal protein L21